MSCLNSTDPSQVSAFQQALDSCKGVNETTSTLAKSSSKRVSVSWFGLVAVSLMFSSLILGTQTL